MFGCSRDATVCTARAGLRSLTLELHVAQVKDGGEQFEDFPGVVLRERKDLQSRTEVGVLLHFVTSLAAGAVTLVRGSHGLNQARLRAFWAFWNKNLSDI